MGTLCTFNMAASAAAAAASQKYQSLPHSFGQFGFLPTRTGIEIIIPAFTSQPPPTPQTTTVAREPFFFNT